MNKREASFKNKVLVPVITIFVVSILILSTINYALLYSTIEVKTTRNLENFVNNIHSQIKHLSTALEITTQVLNDKNIAMARSVSYLLESAAADLTTEDAQRLVELLNLIELNIADGNGVIIQSNVEDYIGLILTGLRQPAELGRWMFPRESVYPLLP